MAQYDDDTGCFWDGVPTRYQEAELIREKAQKWRDKWPTEACPWPAGFERRCQRSRTEVFQKLATLQKRYYATDDRGDIRRIGTHAMLLLIPMLGFGQKRLCQYTGLPCNKRRNSYRFKCGQDVIRCQLRQGRHETVWQILTHFAQKKAPHSDMLGYSMPFISVRWREYDELWEGAKYSDAQRDRDRKEDAIGMAVLKEYKLHRHNAGNSINAAIQAISDRQTVGNKRCGGFDNVRLLYKEYRKTALWRGYADDRALKAECDGKEWPDDQCWLSDFPSMTKG